MAKKKVERTTEHIREEQRNGPGRKYKLKLYHQFQQQLHILGFAAIKEVVVDELNQKSGTIPCILCGHDLHFSISEINNHLHVQCTREGCIKAME